MKLIVKGSVPNLDARHLATRLSPTGLTTTFGYTDGFLTSVTDSPVARSEFYTYENGNVQTHTDYRGLQRTFT